MISTLKQRINTKEKAHNKLHPADPTKHGEGASNHGYLVLRMMLMHYRAYPTIFCALDYRSVSTFHRQSRYGAKSLSFSAFCR